MRNTPTPVRAVMPWSHIAISLMPREISGIYAFWCRDNGKCIYVGQAKGPIKNRLADHWRGSHNETLKLWIQVFGSTLDVCYMSAERSRIDTLERRLIKTWRPEANIQYNR